MKDSTIIAVSIIGSATFIALALILKNKDKGTMLLRDEKGTIEAILPMDGYFINQRTPSQEPTAASYLTSDFKESYLEANQ